MRARPDASCPSARPGSRSSGSSAANELSRGETLLAVAADPVRRRAGPARHHLAELGADVVEADAVLRRDPLREAVVDELAVARPAQLLAVVVRAGTAG